MAYRAGVALQGPGICPVPPDLHISEEHPDHRSRPGEGAISSTTRAQRFHGGYAPSALELAAADIVARSIQPRWKRETGLRMSRPPGPAAPGQKKIDKRLPSVVRICIKFGGIDPVETPIPSSRPSITPWAASTLTFACATSLTGFYAAGSALALSVHGANRLGGIHSSTPSSSARSRAGRRRTTSTGSTRETGTRNTCSRRPWPKGRSR